MTMRRRAVEAMMLAAVGCGNDIPDDAPVQPDAGAPADVRTEEGDAVVEAGIEDADAEPSITFCTAKTGAIACEDFELGLPPTRGFVVVTRGGVALTGDATGPDGGVAGRAIVDMVDAAADLRYARLETELAPGKSSYHLELVAKVDRDDGGSGDVTLASLVVGDVLSNSVKVLAQTSATLLYFCVSGGCVSQTLPEDFASWTKVSVDIQASGAMNVTVGSHQASNAGTDVGAVTQGTAWVGMVFTGTGGRRTLSFDDALISSP